MSILSIKAPFTDEQVKNLNDFQKSGRYHPFTCGSISEVSCSRKKSYEERYIKQQEYLANGIGWLKQQIKELNNPLYKAEELLDWQIANILASEDIPYADENEGILVATTEGWVCPCGEYKQNWAHSFMVEPLPPDPFEKFRNK